MAKGKALLEGKDNSGVLNHIAKFWTFEKGFPLPNWNVTCAGCGSGDLQINWFQFHTRRHSNHLYRCDVSMKCRVCSLMHVHGVVIPEEEFLKRSPDRPQRKYWWRDALAIINE